MPPEKSTDASQNSVTEGSAVVQDVLISDGDLPVELYRQSTSPHTSVTRLMQLVNDSRFESTFVRAQVDGEYVGALPLYLPNYEAWNVPGLGSWVTETEPGPASSWALVGGREDYHSNAYVAATTSLTSADRERIVAEMVDHALAFCTANDRRAILPFAESGAPQADAWLSPFQRHRSIGARYVVPDVGRCLDDYLAKLSKGRRSTVRRDLRDLTTVGIVQEACEDWADVLEWAIEGIASVHAEHGQAVHPVLLQHRLQSYMKDPACQRVAFTAVTPAGEHAATLGWLYDNRLELYEVSLPKESALRLPLYLATLFYGPLNFMWENQIQTLDLAFEAGRPKLLRGAEPRDVSVAFS